jgi:hypothetical protein
VRGVQRIQDRIQDVIGPQERIVIPEPQHAPSGRRHQCCPSFVLRRPVYVLTTIEFDDQALLRTREIREIRSEGMLTAKLEAKDSSIAQMKPQPDFGIRLLST